MTAASSKSPAPLQHPGIPEEPADDDALIEKLRTRAWDPGRRFDRARVPSAWIAERYGAGWFDRPHPGLRATGSDGSVTLESWAEEVATYYAEAPRGPLFPPVTMAEVEDVERRIERRLPDVLRRTWTEVADGGFGPDGGLVSVREGNRVLVHLVACRRQSSAALRLRRLGAGVGRDSARRPAPCDHVVAEVALDLGRRRRRLA